ncbi:hypothetical protein CDV36_013080 [Fusarium kuroshium]|uniref:Uncharacterized protein n=3 Tax=Fusarium solani species complex TaxID=232080 RepID=A0A3M2RPS4_9HYPO|nr:hypothetical protein CDV36_013080 [Fusarium kuroshium]RSL47309.1 hypothetical protein CEP51_015793 [Fusarium floridanum]RSL81995.1 hypothetical protein CEP52_017067 [Fusarium oligoseptatum]
MVFHATTEAAIAEDPLEHWPYALLTTVSRASETQIDEPDSGRLDAGACSMDRGLQALGACQSGMSVTTTTQRRVRGYYQLASHCYYSAAVNKQLLR